MLNIEFQITLTIVSAEFSMNAIAVIPARYASTRLPGKLILSEVKELTGKYIIEHVYERTLKASLIKKVIVATDDERIHGIVKEFGGISVMTPDNILSGTDRIAWVVKNVDMVKEFSPDIIVNVQGDEPDISGKVIDSVVSALSDDDQAVMSTAACPIESLAEFADPNAVKVVLDNMNNALYFSRSSIPFTRDPDANQITGALKHIGLYAFRKEFLLKFAQLPGSVLENVEALEQLRVISNGYKIKVIMTDRSFLGIDTKQDLDLFLKQYRSDK